MFTACAATVVVFAVSVPTVQVCPVSIVAQALLQSVKDEVTRPSDLFTVTVDALPMLV